jgi:hypothetical protein
MAINLNFFMEWIGYLLPILATTVALFIILVKSQPKTYANLQKKGSYVPGLLVFVIALVVWFIIYMLFPDIEQMFRTLLVTE